MSDYHEMFENWSDLIHDYDPDYPIDEGKKRHKENEPVDTDDWAKEDFDGGF
jgi:hypothetical protein